MMKKAQQMRTMFLMGLRDDIRVSTTSLSPGARLMTLQEGQKERAAGHAQGSCHQEERPALQTPGCPAARASPAPRVGPPLPTIPSFGPAHGLSPPQWPQVHRRSTRRMPRILAPPAEAAGHDDVHQGHQDQHPIQYVPAALQVGAATRDGAQGHHLVRQMMGLRTHAPCICGRSCKARRTDPGSPRDTVYLHHHLRHEDWPEDAVGDTEEDALPQETRRWEGAPWPWDLTLPRGGRELTVLPGSASGLQGER